MQYVCRQGDVLDDIAWRQYGANGWDVVNTVLAANPGLAERGPLMPAGLVIELPVIERPAPVRKGVSLWT